MLGKTEIKKKAGVARHSPDQLFVNRNGFASVSRCKQCFCAARLRDSIGVLRKKRYRDKKYEQEPHGSRPLSQTEDGRRRALRPEADTRLRQNASRKPKRI